MQIKLTNGGTIMSLQRMGKYRMKDITKLKSDSFNDYVLFGIGDATLTIENSISAWNSPTRRNWSLGIKYSEKYKYMNCHDPYRLAMGTLKGIIRYGDLCDFDYQDRWFKNHPYIHLYTLSGAEKAKLRDRFFESHYIFGEPKRIRNCI